MEKKAYIAPAIKEVYINLITGVLTTVSGGDAKIIGNNHDDDNESYEQRSRRRNVWSDDESMP